MGEEGVSSFLGFLEGEERTWWAPRESSPAVIRAHQEHGGQLCNVGDGATLGQGQMKGLPALSFEGLVTDLRRERRQGE